MKNYIERVAIVGAGGNSGRYITEALLKTGKHKVSAITRTESTNVLPEGVDVKTVDYNNQASLVEALQGVDALVITLSVFAPEEQQSKLIEAAATAKVPWILPNEWSSDSSDLQFLRDMLMGAKLEAARNLIDELGQSSWIAVVNSFWYEWSLSNPHGFGFDFDKRTVTMFDDGETRINTTTWPQVGRAVASLLSLKVHPEDEKDKSPCLSQFKNNWVYISSFLVSQKDMFDSVVRVTETDAKDWNISYEPSKERYANALEEMKGGDRLGFVKALYTRVFFQDGKGNFEDKKGLANGLLDLPVEDLDTFTRLGIQRAKALSGSS